MDILTNVGTTYDAIDASKGLGGGLLDFTGVSQCKFLVRVKKVGAGTQSWQLWNATDSAEIGVIADAGAVGDKTLQATFSGLSMTGEKEVRIRAKSTNGADDPVFYYGSILLK